MRVSTTAATPLTDASRVTMVDDAPFGELLVPTALRAPDADGGHRYVLLDGGQAAADGRSLETVERRWLEALAARFSAFDRNDLLDVESTRLRQPVPVRTAPFADPTALSIRSRTLPDGVYDATITREPAVPQRRIGGALETGLDCAATVAPAVDRSSNRRLTSQ